MTSPSVSPKGGSPGSPPGSPPGTPSGTPSGSLLLRADVLFPLVVAAVAALARFWYLADYAQTAVFPVLPGSDGDEHYRWASAIAHGELLGARAFMTWPGYAYAAALLLKLSSGSILAVYLVQHLLGIVQCLLVYLVARRLFNPAAGFAAGILCAWYGLSVFYEGLFIYNTLSLFLNSLLLLAVVSLPRVPGWRRLALLGLLLGVATLTQGNILPFGVMAVAAHLWLERSGARAFLARLGVFLAALTLVVGAVSVRNRLVEKDLVLLTGNMGVNFYLANNPAADGVSHTSDLLTPTQGGIFRDSRIVVRVALGREPTTAQVSRYWMEKALQEIRVRPLAMFDVLGKKLVHLLSPREIVHDAEYRYVFGKIPVLAAMIPDLRLIFPLAVLGMVLALPAFRRLYPLYLILATLAASILGFFVTSKYRIVLLPFLAMFAGFGLERIWDAMRRRELTRSLALAGGGLLLFGAFLLVQAKADAMLAGGRARADEYAAIERSTIAEMEGRPDEALRVLEAAGQAFPHSQRLALALGSAYFKRGDLPRAETRLSAALGDNPLSVDAAYNLGLLYNWQRRFAEAAAVLRRARALDPEDVGIRYELAKACRAGGDAACAREELAAALDLTGKGNGADRAILEQELRALPAAESQDGD